MKKYLLLLLMGWMLGNGAVMAQPINDECIDAILLDDVTNWCSGVGAYSNIGATQSAPDNPSCWPQDNFVDVWFAFVAQATDINISVSGNTGSTPGGTLENPEVALYSGNCNNLVEEECNSDAFGNQVAQTFGGPLVIGQLYYIRVSARAGRIGTFQLCINNFNAVPEPSADCPTGVLLCDKSGFTVENVTGAGLDPAEINGATCSGLAPGCAPIEISSSWYKWTCDQAGTLTFSITPLDPSDDIDFVLFELPNGFDNCQDKQAIRCMFSGENVGQPLANWVECTGATGLSANNTDETESCGCQLGNDNFLAPIDMQPGEQYVLMISNFSNSGSGFTIDFGGTGTFLGPTVDFTTSAPEVCFGETLDFTDQSFFPGGSIVDRTWNFGSGATPFSSKNATVDDVTWDTPGTKNVLLSVESDGGCVVTRIETLFVDSCCSSLNAITADALIPPLACWYDLGSIDLSVSSNAAPHTFSWSTGTANEDLSDLLPGDYSVTITNEATCQLVVEETLTAPPAILPEPSVLMPTCDGGQDGVLTMEASGGTPGYTYSFSNGPFSTDNTLENIPIGTYEVSIQDANGCLLDTVVEVMELELELDSLNRVITPPSCDSFSDGQIEVTIVNGQPPYLYDLGDGNGFTPQNLLTDIDSGSYLIQVRDANNCEGNFLLEVDDPPPLLLDFDTTNVSCFGFADGQLAALVEGGVGNYSFSWNNGGAAAVNAPLDVGTYEVTVLDGNNCEIIGLVPVVEPPELFILDVQARDVLCFGDTTGQVTIQAAGGIPDYVYYLAGQPPQIEDQIVGLGAGIFEVVVEDSNGCTKSETVEILEPPPLSIDAGPDQTIELGFDARINTALSPIFWEVDYGWTPADGSLDCDGCRSPLAMPVNTTTYTVTVRDSNNCTAADSVTVFVEKIRPVYIPNVFSPNGDGANDFFSLFGGPATSRVEVLRIFDRWGELVYEVRNIALNDPRLGWDGTFKGKPVDPGVFVYVADVLFIDGVNILFSGDVTVVR